MNEIENATEIAKIKQICEFCVDTSDENCFNCKKVKPISVDDLKAFYKVVLQALQEKQEREYPKRLTLEELCQRTFPVWVADELNGGYWCLCDKGTITAPSGNAFNAKDIPNWEFYTHELKKAVRNEN